MGCGRVLETVILLLQAVAEDEDEEEEEVLVVVSGRGSQWSCRVAVIAVTLPYDLGDSLRFTMCDRGAMLTQPSLIIALSAIG